jgi:hypothetical protein
MTEPAPCDICSTRAVLRTYTLAGRDSVLWICPDGHGVITRNR